MGIVEAQERLATLEREQRAVSVELLRLNNSLNNPGRGPGDPPVNMNRRADLRRRTIALDWEIRDARRAVLRAQADARRPKRAKVRA